MHSILTLLKTGRSIDVYITEAGVTNYDGHGGMDLIQSANFIKEYTSLVKNDLILRGFGGTILLMMEQILKTKSIILVSSKIIWNQKLQLNL